MQEERHSFFEKDTAALTLEVDVNISADDFVAESYRFYYFVTNSRVWLENYDARAKSVQQCDIKLIADNELGFKIEFSNPLYKESPEQSFYIRTHIKHKFGCLISVSHIREGYSEDTTVYGYCDFVTAAVTVVKNGNYHPGRQAFISSGSKEPRSALESRRVSLGAHWVD